MRAWLVVWLVASAAPVLADAPPRIVVAPAGDCAGSERDLALSALSKRSAQDAPATPPGVVHLTPQDVAASALPVSLAGPNADPFGGPGACDNPGSGCVPEKIVEDPDPGTGCGFPGSPCP